MSGTADHAVPRRARSDTPALIPVVIGAGVLLGVVATAGATVFFARDRLHLACSYSEGWACADGISYLGIGAALGGMPTLLAIIGAIVSFTVRRTRPAAVTLVLLATGAAAWPLALTWTSAGQITGAPASLSAWMSAVLPPAIIAVVSLVASIIGLAVHGRAASTLLFVGAGGLCVAAVVQPGLGVGLPAAAGMLAAAGWRIADAALT